MESAREKCFREGNKLLLRLTESLQPHLDRSCVGISWGRENAALGPAKDALVSRFTRCTVSESQKDKLKWEINCKNTRDPASRKAAITYLPNTLLTNFARRRLAGYVLALAIQHCEGR